MTTAHRTKLGDGNVAERPGALPQGETVPITITASPSEVRRRRSGVPGGGPGNKFDLIA
jgi:hypothetical protein